MRLTWVTGLLALALLSALAVLLMPLQPTIIALQLAFTPAAFHSVLAQWGPPGVALYRSHFPADFVLAALYGSFGALLVMRAPAFSALSGAQRMTAMSMMPLAALFDTGENVLHLVLTAPAALKAAPDAQQVVAAAVCASGKWLMLTGFAVVAAKLTLRARRRWVK